VADLAAVLHVTAPHEAAMTTASLPEPAAASAPPLPSTMSYSPTAQVVAAVVRVTAANGHARLELSLHPDELGRVEVRIERSPDGHAAVSIRVERPETLAALQREAPELHAALDRAGLPAAARSLAFDLAPPPLPETAPATSAAPVRPAPEATGAHLHTSANAPATAQVSVPGGAAGGAASGDRQSQPQPRGTPRRRGNRPAPAPAIGAAISAPSAAPRLRAALNLTA
jgi:hypothetical protein